MLPACCCRCTGMDAPLLQSQKAVQPASLAVEYLLTSPEADCHQRRALRPCRSAGAACSLKMPLGIPLCETPTPPLQVELRALLRRCQGLAAGTEAAELPPPLDALPTILQVLVVPL